MAGDEDGEGARSLPPDSRYNLLALAVYLEAVRLHGHCCVCHVLARTRVCVRACMFVFVCVCALRIVCVCMV
jgi:hypothetical protein